ncbi:TetR/AcrR family transcriptional regulator [Roseibium denhamense]|uniref:Transcriptional regulator, TetR family n=1 Tax=Roseibium denhamense TaxID=76305 RepID=A0ABY1NQ51_9HYPH|nr:TetR/AcrR family transcriptional regulator [Roseibium denhamense]MTI07989.1 TetR/AcrR family transcriptional regulator [Roseibium denhamense]SMP15359.1 transcriptional regulator, TetR family [Roseibium denhamense]
MSKQANRGRPRQFDDDIALDQIMHVFWKNGYSSTSLDQIAAATGLNRPSLYAAFGSKKDMYLKVVNRFADRMNAHLKQAGEKESGAAPKLKSIFSAAIDLYTGSTDVSDASLGCLAISTLQSEAVTDPDFQAALDEVLMRMDAGFTALLKREMGGSLPEDAAEIAGSQLAMFLHGLSVRARIGHKPGTLKLLANDVIEKLVRHEKTPDR